MLYQNQTFERQEIRLDGNQYIGCRFVECKLVFTAFEGVSFDRCTFISSEWAMDGPAENTLFFLSALYRGLGPQGQELVEAVFQSIREGTVGELITVPALSTPVALP